MSNLENSTLERFNSWFYFNQKYSYFYKNILSKKSMPILPFKNVEHIIYEHKSEGKLVAVEKEKAKKIGMFFKKYKGKKVKPKDKVTGHWMIVDEEYNSLKIDFETEVKIEIKELELFPLK